MFEFLPVAVIEKIAQKLDFESNTNLTEALRFNKVGTEKLHTLKYNVCPFCILRNFSNPCILVRTSTGEEIFDHFDAFMSFLHKDHKLFTINCENNLFKFVDQSNQFLGKYIDDELNSHTFEEVLEEKSLVNAWKLIVLSSKTFTEQEFDSHLMTHFIGAKGLKLHGPWSPNEMYRIISEIAQTKKFTFNPSVYTNTNYIQVGSIQQQLSRIVACQYLSSDDVIAGSLNQFKLNLSRNLIYKSIKLLHDIELLSKPTESLIHFYRQLKMLRLIFDRI